MNISEAIKPECSRDCLLTEIAIRDQEIVTRDEKIIHLDHKINCLEEQLAWFKRQIFGKRSERVVSDLDIQQLTFDGFGNPASEKVKKKAVAAHERKKPNHDGKDKISLPDDLPVKTTILDISEEEKVCK